MQPVPVGVISIHALLAESDLDNNSAQISTCYISIHALLAESDGIIAVGMRVATAISIHALLAESDRRPLYILTTR